MKMKSAKSFATTVLAILLAVGMVACTTPAPTNAPVSTPASTRRPQPALPPRL